MIPEIDIWRAAALIAQAEDNYGTLNDLTPCSVIRRGRRSVSAERYAVSHSRSFCNHDNTHPEKPNLRSNNQNCRDGYLDNKKNNKAITAQGMKNALAHLPFFSTLKFPIRTPTTIFASAPTSIVIVRNCAATRGVRASCPTTGDVHLYH